MTESYHGIHSNLQFPSSIFNIDRKDVPALLEATNVKHQETIAEKLTGSEYALHLLLAVEAAKQLVAEWTEAVQRWSPPLILDLSICSIDCAVELLQNPERRLLRFWFYSENVPEDWREGHSDRFFDLTVTIDAESLTVQHAAGPSR
ncbi:hypothetical protein NKT34_04385 [Paenibacillus polysaccharolyticus]|uniref:hypothetical protein n=1 Tax=Paenibacillus polysaccharolyticus TaxID=582692 RepID=UPI0020A0D272|nr:hypothetical protein [Paenibacillus polysaccharolyticus]MCP1132516.1 hypothetical protein [Paenibacillus polysaccharolyticus]